MSTLESYLTTIADAIREKKGTTEPINASNFASEILNIQGGGSLNVAYSLTPPTDTSKIWLQCAEPQAVEVQNYLGNVSVSNVANWGVIENPVNGHSDFYSGYYSSCYIGNNQIAIVGYNHIRIYDLTSKKYIADYLISVGTDANYTNVIYKDNVLYFGYYIYIFSFDLTTQTLNRKNVSNNSNNNIYTRYIFFHSSNEIDILGTNQEGTSSDRYRYKLSTSTCEYIKSIDGTYFNRINLYDTAKIIINNKLYHFCYDIVDGNKYHFKYSLISNTISDFTSLENFVTAQGWKRYARQSLVYDGERYVYLIGGNYKTIDSDNSIFLDDIVRYDVINDTFERLGISIFGIRQNSFSLLVDNRVYIFCDGSKNTSARPNQIDYFDLSYPLPQNNCIITTNTINTDNALPLINTDKLKINSNIASAYLGNANNLAEKVNAYYWNGSKWVGINCEDYVESSGTGGGLGGGGDATTDPEIPVDKPVEI